MKNLRELKIWQKAMEITTKVYALANGLPTNERHGLRLQLCKSAVSVPSNIARGAGRNSRRAFKQSLDITSGSLYELETQLLIVSGLSLFDEKQIQPVLQNVSELHKMLYAFKKTLTKSITNNE